MVPVIRCQSGNQMILQHCLRRPLQRAEEPRRWFRLILHKGGYMFWMIMKLISWLYPDFILIPKDQFIIPEASQIIADKNTETLIDPQLYDKILALVRHIETSKSLGENKRIFVKTAISAECRKLDLPQYTEKDVNLARERAIREL